MDRIPAIALHNNLRSCHYFRPVLLCLVSRQFPGNLKTTNKYSLLERKKAQIIRKGKKKPKPTNAIKQRNK